MNDERLKGRIWRKERISLSRFVLHVVSAALLFLGGCSSKGSNSPGPSNPSPSSEEKVVSVVEVLPHPASYTITAVGSLRTPEQVTISPKKAGIIAKILVKEGDRVQKGQVLVELDDVDARLQLERAEARVREAEASLETNRNTLARYQRLLETKVIPQQTYDEIQLKVKLDEARLELARAELNLARQNLADHRIVSPIDGMVNLKIAALGEHVNVAPKDEILKIVQMDPLELEFQVPESWIRKIHVGSKVRFSVKAYPEENFFATLHFISPTVDASTRNIRMKALVRNPSYRLKPGFFAEVSIPAGQNPNALLIPESALFSEEGKIFLFVVQDGIALKREVEIGMRMEGKVEITKGLKKGETVVVAGQEQLRDGMKVSFSAKFQGPSPK